MNGDLLFHIFLCVPFFVLSVFSYLMCLLHKRKTADGIILLHLLWSTQHDDDLMQNLEENRTKTRFYQPWLHLNFYFIFVCLFTLVFIFHQGDHFNHQKLQLKLALGSAFSGHDVNFGPNRYCEAKKTQGILSKSHM